MKDANVIFSVADETTVAIGVTLGSGTLANVHAADWLGLDVAIKQLRPLDEILDASTREHALNDFLNEQNMNMALIRGGQHPDIISFLGICEGSIGGPTACVADSHGLVFERMSGGPLDVRKYGGGSKMKRTVSAALCVARALSHAHRLGIIHRDVKPSNVLCTDVESVKLGDWGLAILSNDRRKSPDTGTAEYMAPEVFLGAGDYDEKADVFSFGIFMYTLGARAVSPYGANYLTAEQAVHAVAHRGLRPTISSSFDLETGYTDLMQACWAADPIERPTMEVVAVRLFTLLKMLRVEEERLAESKQSWSSWLGV